MRTHTCLLVSMGLLVATAYSVASASAALITVGGDTSFDYTSIQPAINNAGTGDVISVAAGYYVEGTSTYRGNGFPTGLNFAYKNNISIIGSGPSTVIDLNSPSYGIMLDASHGITMSNFAMWNGSYTAVTNFNGSSNNLIKDAIFGGTYSHIVKDYYNGVTLSNVTLDPDFTPQVESTPEPSTLAIWAGLGGIGLVVGWRRRRK